MRSWLRRNWWCVPLPVLSFGLLTWAEFVYIGVQARERRWLWAGAVYAALAAIGPALYYGAGVEGASVTTLGACVGGCVHGLALRGRFEARLADRSDTDLLAARRRVAAQEWGRDLVESDPAAARELGIGRPTSRAPTPPVSSTSIVPRPWRSRLTRAWRRASPAPAARSPRWRT